MSNRAGSDRGDGDAGMASGEMGEIAGVVREDHASTEADRCRHDKGIDGKFAAGVCCGEQVTGNSSGARSCGHDLGEAAGEDRIDDGVGAAASVELDEHRGRHAYREVPLVGAAHRGADALMTLRILVRSSERGQRFAVKDQDGHSSS